MGLFSDVQQSWNGFTTIYTRDTLKKPEIPAQNSEKRRIFFENHYFRKSNNLRNCSELVVSLVFELLKYNIKGKPRQITNQLYYPNTYTQIYIYPTQTSKIHQKSNFASLSKMPFCCIGESRKLIYL